MEVKFRKLKANEIDVRVGKIINTEKFSGASLLLYKDARVDMQLLDETVGAMNWQRKHSRDNANCEIGIYDSEKKEWVWKEDTGVESNAEAEKGLASDSFKRAGTNWGIGRELYTAPKIIVDCDLDEKGKAPKAGIAWKVAEITYKDNEIDKLVIQEIYRGKARVVFPKESKKETGQLSGENLELNQLPFNVGNKASMALEQALEIEVNTKEGWKKLKDLTDAQLQIIVKCAAVPEWVDGANLILTYRGGQK